MKKSNLFALLSLVIFAVLAITGYQLKSSLLSSNETVRAAMQANCDLHKSSCTAVFPDGQKATLTMTPNTIPVLKPIQVNLQLEGLDATDVQFNIIGLNMDMGVNRNSLSGNEQQSNQQQSFTGKIILPVCSFERMEWEAQAVITTKDNDVIIAPFQFYSAR